MKDFDINLGVCRSVVALVSDMEVKKGERYFVRSFDVTPSRTYLRINGRQYNSVNFTEIEDSSLMKALSKVKSGNKPKIIAQLTRAMDLKLLLSAYCFPAMIDDDVLSSMPLEGTITIGRDPSCDVKSSTIRLSGKMVSMGFSSEVSRMHAIIYREREDSWVVIDVSSFGTRIVI